MLKKFIFLFLSLWCFICCAQNPTHIANNIVEAYEGSVFETSAHNLFFIEKNGNGICALNKTSWKGGVIHPSNSCIPTVQKNAGIKWHDDKLFFVETDLKLSFLEWTPDEGWERTHFNHLDINAQSSFVSVENLLFYIDKNLNICVLNTTNYTQHVLVNDAKKARIGTDMIWKNDKLYYIGEDHKIYYMHFSENGWTVSSPFGDHIHKQSHLAVSRNNIYYVNTNRQMVSTHLNKLWTSVINPSAPKVKPGSDLKWIDEKLFYVSENNAICYHYWYRVQKWEWHILTGKNVHSNTQLKETNHKNIVFIDKHNKVNYFRAPINLKPVDNSIYKEAWTYIEHLSDEFNKGYLDQTKWFPHYNLGDYNHPVEKVHGSFPSKYYSYYYNETDLSSHHFYTTKNQNVLGLETTNIGAPYKAFVRSTDINDGNYQYKSAMIMGTEKYKHGYLEMRCKVPKSNHQKSTFWMFGGSDDNNTIHEAYEIDIFEIEGEGISYPTNYHEYLYSEPGVATTDRYDIFPLKNQSFAHDFYTYGLEWDEDKVIWYINNEVVRIIHKNQQYPKVLLPDGALKTLVTNRVWSLDYNIPFKLPNYYEVDYVRLYFKQSENETEIVEEPGKEPLPFTPANIYPNPSTDIVQVVLNAPAQVNICNELGQSVFKTKLKEGAHTLHLKQYGLGLYFVHFTHHKHTSTHKVVIQ